jgi:hypothetical protein
VPLGVHSGSLNLPWAGDGIHGLRKDFSVLGSGAKIAPCPSRRPRKVAAHHPRHAVYASEAIGLLGIELGLSALTLIRYWSLR